MHHAHTRFVARYVHVGALIYSGSYPARQSSHAGAHNARTLEHRHGQAAVAAEVVETRIGRRLGDIRHYLHGRHTVERSVVLGHAKLTPEVGQKEIVATEIHRYVSDLHHFCSFFVQKYIFFHEICALIRQNLIILYSVCHRIN